MTLRHDYMLDRRDDALPMEAGMTDSEREFLYRQMDQIYEHNFADTAQRLHDLETGKYLVLPQDREHAQRMLQVAQYFLDHLDGKI